MFDLREASLEWSLFPVHYENELLRFAISQLWLEFFFISAIVDGEARFRFQSQRNLEPTFELILKISKVPVLHF